MFRMFRGSAHETLGLGAQEHEVQPHWQHEDDDICGTGSDGEEEIMVNGKAAFLAWRVENERHQKREKGSSEAITQYMEDHG